MTNSIPLALLVATLTEEIFPREVVINENGVYLHTWMLSVFDDGKGSYFRIYLCRKNGIWGYASCISGRTWGYHSPLWDGDFQWATLEDALRDAWKEDFERVEPCFHERPKFYDKAKNFFDRYMALPFEEKLSHLVIRD